MTTATNPQTGERVYLDEATSQWLPVQSATNPQTGEKLVFMGKGWEADFPDVAPGFTPQNAYSASPPSRRAARMLQDPQWPATQGPLDAPSLSDTGDVGPQAAPFATAFPPSPSAFPQPAGSGIPQDYPITDTGIPGSSVDPSRPFKIGAQAIGGGLANLAGLPFDLPIMGGQLAGWGVEKGINAAESLLRYAGLPIDTSEAYRNLQEDRPRIPLVSDLLKSGASRLGGMAGYEEVTPTGLPERAASNALQLITEGAGAFPVIRGAARRMTPNVAGETSRLAPFISPYAERPNATMLGDIVAGGGAGATSAATQEYLPEDIRQAGGGTAGVLADLLAMAAGGYTGGQAITAATRGPQAAFAGAQGRMPARDFIDPSTGKPWQNRDVNEAAQILQGVTTYDPRGAAAEIGQSLKQFENLPTPTLGGLSTDPGLISMENLARTKGPGFTLRTPEADEALRQQFSFGGRDTALRQEAANQVRGIRPEGIDPEGFIRSAEAEAARRIARAQSEIDLPTTAATGVQQTREAAARPILATEGQTPAASRNIHDVYGQARTLDQQMRERLYQDPAWTNARVPADPLRQAAREVNLDSSLLTPAGAPVKNLLDRIFAQLETGGTIQGKYLSDFNAELEGLISSHLTDKSQFQNLKRLKDSIAASIENLPPGAAKDAIDRANAYFRSVTQPEFRQYAGEAIDQSLKTRPGQTYPSETGPRVTERGEDVSQLFTTAQRVGQTPFVAGQVRAMMLDDLTRSGVITDGVINPNKLTRWRNRNQDRIDRVPGLRAEVDNILADAQSHTGQASRYAQEIKDAEARMAQTQADIKGGPLGAVAGKLPEKAVTSILSSDDPVKAVRDLRQQLGNDAKANESLRAAVADHFIERAKALDPLLDKEYGVKLQRLVEDFNKHRNTMVEAGFTTEDMQALQRAQTLLKPLTKRNVQATVGSATAERAASSEAALRPVELALKGYYGILAGGGAFRTLKIALKTITGDRAPEVGKILNAVMFDPKMAQALLTRDVKKVNTPTWNANLQKALRRYETARELADEDIKPEQE